MKKIITTIFITMLAVVLAVMPAAGCSKCEHSVDSWEIVQEATCTTPGLKQGYCGICYELVQEEIPIDPDAHVYGDWAVAAPTTTSTGVAIKTCTECGHYERVTLPVLTDINYTSQVTKRPSASTDGVSQYTYSSEEYGDIVFDVTIGSEGIQTVGDAVSVGALLESHDMIRSVTGTRGDKRVDSGVITDPFETVADSTTDFSYELYDEYTHLNSVDGSEYWMGIDDGEIYGYQLDEQKNFNIVDDTNYFYGFRYYLTYTDTLSYYYGTENFLSGLYTYAKKNVNGDFEESVNKDGSYSFSFGTYTIYSGGTNGALYSEIVVNFTLSSSYTIETFTYSSITYANDSTAYDATTGKWGSDATFLFDEDGNAYVTSSNGLKYVETYTVTQTLRQSGEKEEENPYTPDTRFYTSFDVTYDGTVIDGNTNIELVAGTTSSYVFGLENFAPSDVVGDTITFYYKTYDSANNTYEYTEVDVNTESSVGIFIHLNSYNKFCIKSNIAGDITIVVSSRKVMKEVTITFTSNAPSALYPTVYNYSSTVGYVESTPADSGTNSATIYVGQPLYFKSSLSAAEESSCSASYVTTVLYVGGSGSYEINDSTSVYLNSSSEYVPVSSFTAYKTGTYVLTLTSTENSSVYCTITVTVEEAPSVSGIFMGTYTGTFTLTGDSVTVTFGEVTTETAEYTVTAEDGTTSTEKAVKYTVIATVTYDGEIPVQCVFYTSEDGTKMLNSGYTQVYNAEDMVTSTLTVEVDEDVYNFTISLNEAFCLTISHNLGDEFDNANETAVLNQAK